MIVHLATTLVALAPNGHGADEVLALARDRATCTPLWLAVATALPTWAERRSTNALVAVASDVAIACGGVFSAATSVDQSELAVLMLLFATAAMAAGGGELHAPQAAAMLAPLFLVLQRLRADASEGAAGAAAALEAVLGGADRAGALSDTGVRLRQGLAVLPVPPTSVCLWQLVRLLATAAAAARCGSHGRAGALVTVGITQDSNARLRVGVGAHSPQAAQEAIAESYQQLMEGDVARHPVATHLPLYLLYAPLATASSVMARAGR